MLLLAGPCGGTHAPPPPAAAGVASVLSPAGACIALAAACDQLGQRRMAVVTTLPVITQLNRPSGQLYAGHSAPTPAG